MTKNPLFNALAAIAYIVALVSTAVFAPTFLKTQQDNMFMPMGALAVLVLSVALMAYLFFYQPVIMLLDGEREAAAKLFLRTIGIFAVATILILFTAAMIARTA